MPAILGFLGRLGPILVGVGGGEIFRRVTNGIGWDGGKTSAVQANIGLLGLFALLMVARKKGAI